MIATCDFFQGGGGSGPPVPSSGSARSYGSDIHVAGGVGGEDDFVISYMIFW